MTTWIDNPARRTWGVRYYCNHCPQVDSFPLDTPEALVTDVLADHAIPHVLEAAEKAIGR